MKVLHFYKAALPNSIGGVEQVIHQISLGGVSAGIDSTVLALVRTKTKDINQIGGYNVYFCHTDIEILSTPFSLCAFSKFKSLVKESDIIHYHFPYPFADLLHFVTRVGKPTIVTYHSDIVKQQPFLKLYSPLMNKFLGSVDRIVATSPNYVETSTVLQKFYTKTSVIPIGLDKSKYPVPDANRLRYWKDRVGDNFFLFIGVLRYYKGLHVLIEAAKNLSCSVVVAGSGPLESDLKNQARMMGIKNVHFVGFVSDEDKVSLIALSYAVLLPSNLRSEAFGISLLEGAMYGKPLISSETGTGTSYININKETGLTVPPGDFEALRQSMNYLWNNSALARNMGRCAEKRYWSLFTAKKMTESYIKMYEDLSR